MARNELRGTRTTATVLSTVRVRSNKLQSGATITCCFSPKKTTHVQSLLLSESLARASSGIIAPAFQRLRFQSGSPSISPCVFFTVRVYSCMFKGGRTTASGYDPVCLRGFRYQRERADDPGGRSLQHRRPERELFFRVSGGLL